MAGLKQFINIMVFIVLLFGNSLAVLAESVEDIKVLRIAPQDQIAVIKEAGDKQKIIKVGDSVGEFGQVIEITTGRIVIQKKNDDGVELTIIRLEDGEQKIEQIIKGRMKKPLFQAPR